MRTPARLPALILLAAAVSGCLPITGAGAGIGGQEQAALFRSFVAAINVGDPAAAKALFKADATWERGGQCPPGACAGLERLGEEIDRDVANHHRIDILSIESAGSGATARVELRNDGTRSASVERIIQIFAISVGEGKIASLRAVNDVSDPVTVEFVSRPRQPPPGAGRPGG